MTTQLQLIIIIIIIIIITIIIVFISTPSLELMRWTKSKAAGIWTWYFLSYPVSVAARSKFRICGRSLAEIVGSKPNWGAWMFVVSVGCCQVEVSATSYRCVWSRNLVNEEALTHWGAVAPKKKLLLCINYPLLSTTDTTLDLNPADL